MVSLPPLLAPDTYKPKERLRSDGKQAKLCPQCGAEFVRNTRKLSNAQWASQIFCSSRCASLIPLSERLHSAIVADDQTGCWNWTGVKIKRGYGRIVVRVDGQRVQLGAHRAAYSEWVGPIPEGMMVLHKCDNPSCINPEHLRLGTHLDNMFDRSERKRCRNQYGRPKKYASA